MVGQQVFSLFAGVRFPYRLLTDRMRWVILWRKLPFQITCQFLTLLGDKMSQEIREALEDYQTAKRKLSEAETEFRLSSDKLFESAKDIKVYKGSRIKKFLVDDSLVSLNFASSEIDIEPHISL